MLLPALSWGKEGLEVQLCITGGSGREGSPCTGKVRVRILEMFTARLCPGWVTAGDPNIRHSSGRICKDSGSGDKGSGLIHASSVQGDGLLWAVFARLRGRDGQSQMPQGRREHSQLSGKWVCQ